MLESAGFDVLGVGTLVGMLLFLGALIWVLVDNRSFDDLQPRSEQRGAPDGDPVRPERPERPSHRKAA